MDTEEKSNQLEHETALNNQTLYWQANLKLLVKLLVVWFAVSFGCGIILVDWLDQFTIAGFKLGFWFAQQGAIYGFILLTFIYALAMARLEKRLGLEEPDA